MSQTPQKVHRKEPKMIVEYDHHWMVSFFEVLLGIFEPMLDNPLSLKILSYENDDQVVSNDPSEILSHLQVHTPILKFIRDKIHENNQGVYQHYSRYMIVFVTRLTLALTKIKAKDCLRRELFFEMLNKCEVKTLEFLKSRRMSLNKCEQDSTLAFEIGNEKFLPLQFFQMTVPELAEEFEEIKNLIFHPQTSMMSFKVLDVKRGSLYSQDAKKIEFGIAFPIPISYSNVDFAKEKMEWAVPSSEVLLLDLQQDKIPNLFIEENSKKLEGVKLIFVTGYFHDILKDKCTQKKITAFSNLRFKDLKRLSEKFEINLLTSVESVGKTMSSHKQTFNVKIKILTSLQKQDKESSYTNLQDPRNSVLSYNHYVVFTTETNREREPIFLTSLDLIYYNFSSSNSLLKAQNFWVQGLLKKMLNILHTKKIFQSKSSIEHELKEFYQALSRQEDTGGKSKSKITWEIESSESYILKIFFEILKEHFEFLDCKIREQTISSNCSNKYEIDDYVAKKHIIKESFKLIKLIFLHQYGIHI